MASSGSPSPDKKALCDECNHEWDLVKKLSQEEIENKIFNYLNTQVQLQGYVTRIPSNRSLPSQSLATSSSLPLEPPKSDEPISYNAIAQKEASAKKKELEKELAELQAMSKITTNPEYYKSFSSQVSYIEKISKVKMFG
ncbi:hypothetical protein C2G38_2040688 [Gigaspora rosea]|uniref:Uncharacterized protein n=1 Tax=Gigaspora rosea TaxID=44941 RepID=A0A397UXA6_9GLOM|nr:hypothetical protein C2G38_2040688 [Gigaspora rosea]